MDMQRLSDEYFLFQLAQGVRGSRTENTSPQPVISKQPCVFIYVIVICIILDALIESVFYQRLTHFHEQRSEMDLFDL